MTARDAVAPLIEAAREVADGSGVVAAARAVAAPALAELSAVAGWIAWNAGDRLADARTPSVITSARGLTATDLGSLAADGRTE